MVPQVCLRAALYSLHRHWHVVSSIRKRCCNRMLPASVPSVDFRSMLEVEQASAH